MRIIPGWIGPTDIRSSRAEEMVIGLAKADGQFLARVEKIASIAAEDTDPVGDTRRSVDYKRQMVRICVKDCILGVQSLEL